MNKKSPKEYAYDYIKRVNDNISFFEKITEENSIPDNDDMYDDNHNFKPIYKLEEIYYMKNAQENVIRKTTVWSKRLGEIYEEFNIETSNLIVRSDNLKMKATSELDVILDCPPIDKPSHEKRVIFTGLKGSLWYDEPLTSFIKKIIYTEVLLKNGIIRINSMKNLLKYVKEKYGHSDKIGDYNIPVNYLIYFIQQLLLIEEASMRETGKNKEKIKAKNDRINRAVYNIHSNLQISPTTLSDILNKNLCILDCGSTCILQRSTKEFFKHELPDWVKNVYNNI